MIHDDLVSGVAGVIGTDPPPFVRDPCTRCEGTGDEPLPPCACIGLRDDEGRCLCEQRRGEPCSRCRGTKLERSESQPAPDWPGYEC